MEDNLRENLFFDPKNGYDRIDTEEVRNLLLAVIQVRNCQRIF